MEKYIFERTEWSYSLCHILSSITTTLDEIDILIDNRNIVEPILWNYIDGDDKDVDKLKLLIESSIKKFRFRQVEEQELDLSFLESVEKENLELGDMMLTPFQYLLMEKITEETKLSHERALPKLRERVEKLNFDPETLDTLLEYLSGNVKLNININIDSLCDKLMSDGIYKNCFEIHAKGDLYNSYRFKVENNLFGIDEKINDWERPKYGVVNLTNDWNGVYSTRLYGNSYIVLKDYIKKACTFCSRDSFLNITRNRLGTFRYMAHVVNEFSDKALIDALMVGPNSRIGEDVLTESSKNFGYFLEFQLHKTLNLQTDVQLVVANKDTEAVRKFAKYCNCPIVFKK